MELKQLEAFVAVVDYNSFSEAARHLFLTQPTVSAHVASLGYQAHFSHHKETARHPSGI